ncbi:MAG: peptidase C39 family protein [Herpetosiphonaceae bacterium]|nr:peptidase C39 family protein [Herpetosiphonaceae bacterium]
MCAGRRLALMTALSLCFFAVQPARVQSATYNTAFSRYRAVDGTFAGWELNGVVVDSSGELQLSPAMASPGTDPYPPNGYHGHNFYNGGSFIVGEATSPVNPTSFAYMQAIASWNADTPAGAWIETRLRVKVDGHWTNWYNMGVWAADSSTIERHSVDQQDDADGTVDVDTLKLSAPATAWQFKLRLFSADGTAIPTVRNAGVTVSTTPPESADVVAGNPTYWNHLLAVPQCSQMVYPNGGENWCSPTSTSMVVGYWANDNSTCAERVQAAVAGTYDWLYDGNGNWPFNTGYAATHSLESNVVRFTSLAQVEPWIAAGVPIVFSFSWKQGQLTGAPIPSSAGHLAVIVGFDAEGNPIVNDPAAATDATVQRTYLRSELEPLWLQNSGGTVYLMYVPGQSVPPLPAGYQQPVDLPLILTGP